MFPSVTLRLLNGDGGLTEFTTEEAKFRIYNKVESLKIGVVDQPVALLRRHRRMAVVTYGC
jgi:hypothetical protein